MSHDMKKQKGSVMTLALGGIAMTAVLGIATFSLMSGPLNTMVSVNKKAIAQSQVEAIARIALMDAQMQPDGGDPDGDTIVELRPGRDGGAGIDPREYVPYTLGAPTIDPWGTEYSYCVWDMGAQTDAASTTTLDGADDPFRAADDANAATKSAASQVLIAVFSAGPDGTASSTCADWTSDTAPVFTCAGDDICKKYTYSEAAKTVGGIWEIKQGSPSTITTRKNLEIGSSISIEAATGSAEFTTVETTGKIIATGGLQLPLETDATVNALCGASYEGLLRFNAAAGVLQVCNGASWDDILGGSGGDSAEAESEWAETSGGSGSIYYNDGGVMVGTTSIGASESLKAASSDQPGAINIVQIAPSYASTGTWPSSSTITFEELPQAGSTIIVTISLYNNTGGAADRLPASGAVTDNQGNTYVRVVAENSAIYTTAYIYAAYNIPAPSGTFTLTLTPTYQSIVDWNALEVSGLAASSTVDRTGTATHGCCSDTTTVTNSGGATSQANELAIAVHTITDNPDDIQQVHDSSWTQFYLDNQSSNVAASHLYKLLTTTQTVSHTWTYDSSNPGAGQRASAAIATFRGALADPPAAASARNLELASHSNTAGDGDAHLDFFHAEGSLSSPQNIEVGDNSGYINYYGYKNGWKKGFQWTQEVNAASGASDYKFALGNSDDTLDTIMWLSSLPGLTVGPVRGSGGVNVSGTDPDILLDTYSTTAGNGSFIQLRKSRGTMPATHTALQNGNMLGAITWQGRDSNSMSSAAAMNVIVNGTISNTILETDMVFQVSPAGNALATAINGEALRLKAAADIGINHSTPADEMTLNGILRITDTRHSDTLQTDLSQSTFLFIPSRATWRMGYSDDNLGVSTPPTYNAMTTGYDGENNADDSWHHGSGVIGPGAHHSFVLGGDTDAYAQGSYSIGNRHTAYYGPSSWTVNDATNAAPYSFVISTDEFTLGSTASHSALMAAANAVVNGSYSYGFGSSFTIDDANPSGGDYIFAVNLADVATTFTQPNTFSVMNGNVGVGNSNPGSYRLLVTGTANKTSGGTVWDVVSDARLKDVHGPYAKGLSHLRLLSPVRFRYKEGNPLGHDPTVEIPGFVAQSVQQVFPEAVKTREDGYLDLDMHPLNVAKVNAVKELYAEQQELLAEQVALKEEQQNIREEYASLRRDADALMARAGIPSLRGFWTALGLPLLAFLALGLSAARGRK